MIVLMDKPQPTGCALEEALIEEGWNPEAPPLYINWTGRRIGQLDSTPVLNLLSRTDKLAQLVRLQLQGVAIPSYSTSSVEGWLPRTAMHKQGRDFTQKKVKADFWVEKLALEEEWRLHFFRSKKGNLRLLRSAKRVPKEGMRHHPWVRSHRLGWKLSYCGGASPVLVQEGRKAMEALQLDFGAVDLGVEADTSVFVLEVNTCPGLEDGTLAIYVQQFLERSK